MLHVGSLHTQRRQVVGTIEGQMIVVAGTLLTT